MVLACHCDFCQKRTGSLLSVGAVFDSGQVVDTVGEIKTYNGLEVDGVGAQGGIGIDYKFCATCGATVFWTFVVGDASITEVAVGNFVDPDFPVPTIEYHTATRHHWLPPVPGADQYSDSGEWSI